MAPIIVLVLKSSSLFFPRLLETRTLQKNLTHITACSGYRKGALQVQQQRQGGAYANRSPFKTMIHEVREKSFHPGHWNASLKADLLQDSSVLMIYVGTKANCHGNAYLVARTIEPEQALWHISLKISDSKRESVFLSSANENSRSSTNMHLMGNAMILTIPLCLIPLYRLLFSPLQINEELVFCWWWWCSLTRHLVS